MSTRRTRGSAPLLHFKLSGRSGESPYTRLKKKAGEDHRRNFFQTPKPLDCTVISKHSGNRNPQPGAGLTHQCIRKPQDSSTWDESSAQKHYRDSALEWVRERAEFVWSPNPRSKPSIWPGMPSDSVCTAFSRGRFSGGPFTKNDKFFTGRYPDLRKTNL